MEILKSKKALAIIGAVVVLVVAGVIWGVASGGGSSNSGGSSPSGSTATSKPTKSAATKSPASTSSPTKSGSTPSGSTPTFAHPTLKGATMPTAAPIGLDAKAPLKSIGSTARITKIESVESKASTPGELSRPAIRVTVAITAGSKSVKLSNVVVNAYYGYAMTPALQVAKPGGIPFGGTLKPGRTAKGVYIFNVPVKSRGDVRIEISYDAKSPTAIFEGKVG